VPRELTRLASDDRYDEHIVVACAIAGELDPLAIG
jgi:hypothetical protein